MQVESGPNRPNAAEIGPTRPKLAQTTTVVNFRPILIDYGPNLAGDGPHLVELGRFWPKFGRCLAGVAKFVPNSGTSGPSSAKSCGFSGKFDPDAAKLERLRPELSLFAVTNATDFGPIQARVRSMRGHFDVGPPQPRVGPCWGNFRTVSANADQSLGEVGRSWSNSGQHWLEAGQKVVANSTKPGPNHATLWPEQGDVDRRRSDPGQILHEIGPCLATPKSGQFRPELGLTGRIRRLSKIWAQDLCEGCRRVGQNSACTPMSCAALVRERDLSNEAHLPNETSAGRALVASGLSRDSWRGARSAATPLPEATPRAWETRGRRCCRPAPVERTQRGHTNKELVLIDTSKRRRMVEQRVSHLGSNAPNSLGRC